MVELDLPGLPPTEATEIQRQMLRDAFRTLQEKHPMVPDGFWQKIAALVHLAFLVGKGDGITSLGADVKEMIHKTLRSLS